MTRWTPAPAAGPSNASVSAPFRRTTMARRWLPTPCATRRSSPWQRSLGRRDEGFVQITQGTGDVAHDRHVVERIAEISGRPVLYNVLIPRDDHPELYQSGLRWIEDCNRRGLRIFAQSLTVRGPFAFTLEDWNLYDARPRVEPCAHRLR